MPPRINLIGQKFGRLTVIEKAPSRKGKTYWKCLCDCGEYKVVQTRHLKNGKIRSCGCLSNENNPFNHTFSDNLNAPRICPLCGEKFIPNNVKRIYCYNCIPKGLPSKERIKLVLRLLKHKLILYKGGKCERCGYNKCDGALQFHHKNPFEKEFALSQVHLNSKYTLERLYKEVDKCELLCANCHAETHYDS